MIVKRILRNYVRGRVSRAFTLGVIGPLTNGGFAVGAMLAIAYLPTSYDIRRTWVSSLASARSNPTGYFYLGTTLMVVAVLLVPLPGYFSRRLRPLGLLNRAGWLSLSIGIAALFLLGIETTVFPNPGRTRFVHQLFTVITLTGITLGFLSFAILSGFRAWIRNAVLLPAGLACAVLSIPGIGAGLTHVARFAEAQGWSSIPASKYEAAFFLTFVFWEWASVIGLFVGGWLTAWAASRRGSRRVRRAAPHRTLTAASTAASETPVKPAPVAAAPRRRSDSSAR